MASAGSAVLAGFLAGLPGLALPAPSPLVAAVVVLAAVSADLAGIRPLAVRRQVPVAWSRLFPPEVVGLLYGARLGVGPLTILPTWLWWAAFLLAAADGPFTGMAVGAVFALARSAVTLGYGLRSALRVHLDANRVRSDADTRQSAPG